MDTIDAQFIEARFAATEPKRRGLSLLYAPALGLMAGLLLLPVLGPALSPGDAEVMGSVLLKVVSIVLLLASAGLFAAGAWSVGRRQQRCRRRVLKVWEHALLEQWDQAESALDPALSGPIPGPSDRCQAFMVLAALAEHKGLHAGAAQIYETLLLGRIGDPLNLQRAQISLAAAKIHNQELTDAVTYLGRLEQITMPAGLRAALDLVRLFQQVFMGHHEDAVESYEDRCQVFRRHLSTHAGYGYGLLAAAMHNLGRTEEAARLWGDATTLITTDRLVGDYALLAPMCQAYPATEHRV